MRLSGMIKKGAHVLLSISLLNEDQTGAGFAEIIDLVLFEPNIERITIHIADTLQKYHLQLLPGAGGNLQVAKKMSIEKRQEWEIYNKIALEKLYNSGKFVKTIFWDDVIRLDTFERYRKIIDEFYVDSGKKRFAHLVDSLAVNFSRKTKQMLTEPIDIETIVKAEKLYCLDECAGVVALSHDLESKYDYEIYAGDRNRPMQIAYKEYGCPLYMHPIAILKENKNILSKTTFFPPSSSDKNVLEFHYKKNGVSLDLSIQSLDQLNKETIQALTTLVSLIQTNTNEDNSENTACENNNVKTSEIPLTRSQNATQL